jgi:hypothetical protein
MRRRFIYDHDMDCMIEIGAGTNHPDPTPGGLQIIRDIDPYRPVAADVAVGDKRPIIGGRRQHREFLRRNGYVEVGNEVPTRGERPTLSEAGLVEDIKRAMGAL